MNRYVPKVSRNPLRLAASLLFSRNPAARSALFMAAAGIIASPFNKLLSGKERRRLQSAPPPSKPIVIVCGPPRSGTTLVAQFLVNALDVAYLNNLTSLFPSAPLTVNAAWGEKSIQGGGGYRAFYGKSRGLAGANDALYIWDRWLGPDRSQRPAELVGDAAVTMPQFFGALEEVYEKPLVTKVNRLNLSADLVAPHLPSAVFVFVDREPLWLAQSLYVAREKIAGDLSMPYGTEHSPRDLEDPIADVALQVAFHRRESEAVRRAIPKRQQISLDYEAFCAAPQRLLERVHRRLDEDMPELRDADDELPSQFRVSSKQKVDDTVFERLKELVTSP